MQTKISIIAYLSLSCASLSAQTAGPFRNLDFEWARLTPTPPGTPGGFVPIADALPYWSGYVGTDPITRVLQNNLTLSGGNIAILGPHCTYCEIIEGQYMVVLQPAIAAEFGGISLGTSLAQFGRLPGDAQSIQLKLDPYAFLDSFSVTFAGQEIPLVPIGEGINYVLYAGDISGFTGQSGELRFEALAIPGDFIALDSIEFSPVPVPEPGAWAIVGLGVGILGWRWRRTRFRLSAGMG